MLRGYIPDNHDIFVAEEHEREERRKREILEHGIGECAHCEEPVLDYESYYNVNGAIVHSDCGLDWLWQFKVH